MKIGTANSLIVIELVVIFIIGTTSEENITTDQLNLIFQFSGFLLTFIAIFYGLLSPEGFIDKKKKELIQKNNQKTKQKMKNIVKSSNLSYSDLDFTEDRNNYFFLKTNLNNILGAAVIGFIVSMLSHIFKNPAQEYLTKTLIFLELLFFWIALAAVFWIIIQWYFYTSTEEKSNTKYAK